jgi:hypothetical protein
MMYGSYVSYQSVEVFYADKEYEAEFIITLNCTVRRDPGRLSGPPEHCYPPEGPEFELDSIHVLAQEGKREISEDVLRAMLGDDMADKLLERAYTDAAESGDF